jgi:hypothetical protein
VHQFQHNSSLWDSPVLSLLVPLFANRGGCGVTDQQSWVFSQRILVALGNGTGRNLLKLGNELSLEKSELCFLLTDIENAIVALHSLTPCGGGLEYLHRSPASHKRRRRGNTVSVETVMYGYWSSVTWPVSDCTVGHRPVLSSERAPYRKNNKATVTKKKIRIKSVHGPQRGARYQDELVDWL